jgi:hypothetical protein
MKQGQWNSERGSQVKENNFQNYFVMENNTCC